MHYVGLDLRLSTAEGQQASMPQRRVLSFTRDQSDVRNDMMELHQPQLRRLDAQQADCPLQRPLQWLPMQMNGHTCMHETHLVG